MNIMQVAVVLIRLSGIIWFVEAVLVFSSFPSDIWQVIQPHAQYYATLYIINTVERAFRVLLYVGLGSVYWLYTIPLARYVTKGVEWIAPSERDRLHGEPVPQTSEKLIDAPE